MANRNLAWVNSICVLFLVIGVLGARSRSLSPRTPPPLEEIIPTIIEPLPPPPTPVEVQPNQESSNQETPDPAAAVVVTPDIPSIVFSVPTVGNLVLPAALAKPPPATPLGTSAVVRRQPTAIDSTGAEGSRPMPPYPKIALEQSQQGSVLLSLTVDDAGAVVTIQVKESSGFPLLDRGALEFVKKHWTLPTGAGTRVYEATITYKLVTN